MENWKSFQRRCIQPLFLCAERWITVHAIPGLDKLKAIALHPGKVDPAPVVTSLKDGTLTLTVPLVRGCAMVKLTPSP